MLTRKAFKYRLSPTKQQEYHLLFVLRRCRELHNSGLEQRRAYYQMRHKSLGYSQQAAELAEIKAAYECGAELDCDYNSAITILFRGETSGPQVYGSIDLPVLSRGSSRNATNG